MLCVIALIRHITRSTMLTSGGYISLTTAEILSELLPRVSTCVHRQPYPVAVVTQQVPVRVSCPSVHRMHCPDLLMMCVQAVNSLVSSLNDAELMIPRVQQVPPAHCCMMHVFTGAETRCLYTQTMLHMQRNRIQYILDHPQDFPDADAERSFLRDLVAHYEISDYLADRSAGGHVPQVTSALRA